MIRRQLIGLVGCASPAKSGWFVVAMNNIRVAVLCVIVVLSLLWPAILNGQYIFMADSVSYVRAGASVFKGIFHVDSPWLASNAAQASGTGAGAAVGDDGYVIAGRSVYYGLILNVSALLSGLWVALIFQAACITIAIVLTARALCGTSLETALLVASFVGLTSAASFFASYLMPDVFTGIAILAIANLFILYTRQNRTSLLLWFLLLTMALVSHLSHVLLASCLVAIGGCFALFRREQISLRGMTVVGAAVALALFGELAFSITVERMYGAPPLRPPFVMAQVLADEPGYTYLKSQCPAARLKLCDFVSILPQSADTLLWSQDPAKGIYYASDVATRRVLSNEQFQFAMQVLQYDFLGQMRASLLRFVQQLLQFNIMEFAYSPDLRNLLMERLPPSIAETTSESRFFRDTFPLTVISIFFNAVLLMAIVIAVACGIQAVYRVKNRYFPDGVVSGQKLVAFLAVVLTGMVLNAAITGIFSGPYNRYQARVIWLLVLCAMLVCVWSRIVGSASQRR
jgi:hypothetical protein